jgi:hypothetical protein
MGKGSQTDAYYVHGECLDSDPLYVVPSPRQPRRLLPRI